MCRTVIWHYRCCIPERGKKGNGDERKGGHRGKKALSEQVIDHATLDIMMLPHKILLHARLLKNLVCRQSSSYLDVCIVLIPAFFPMVVWTGHYTDID